MISTLLSKIVALVAIPVLFFTGVFAPEPAPIVPVEPLGVALPSGTATFETSLASPITNSATTMLLSSVSVRGGTTLSGYQCFAIDEGSAQAEFVCGTASSTSITGLERGLSPADGVTETTALKFSHRRGASVKITDFPLIQRLKSQASGSGTYEGVLSYASGVTPTGGSELVDVEYLTSVVTGTSTLSYNKTIVNGTAGETLATGTIVYLKASDSRWYKADNDDTSTYVDQTLGIAQGAGTSGNTISGGVLTYGLDSTQKGMTGGNFIFLSGTAGATTTATTSQILGKAVSATTMFFDQNLIDSSVYVPTTFVGTTTFIATTTSTGGLVGFGTAPSTTIYSTAGTSTYSVPSNLRWLQVEVVGGGSGGAGYDTDGTACCGNSGGAGGYGKSIYTKEQLGTTSVTLVVGAGGAGGASADTPTGGTKGNPSKFIRSASNIILANGGSAASILGEIGGIGGVTTGAQINISGGSGSGSEVGGKTGYGNPFGGSSILGGGSIQYSANNGSESTPYGYGYGGAGGVDNISYGDGLNGGTGVIIITEYF